MTRNIKHSSGLNSPLFIISVDIFWIFTSIVLSYVTQHDIKVNGCISMKGGGCITAYSDPVNYWIFTHLIFIALILLIVGIPVQVLFYKHTLNKKT